MEFANKNLYTILDLIVYKFSFKKHIYKYSHLHSVTILYAQNIVIYQKPDTGY